MSIVPLFVMPVEVTSPCAVIVPPFVREVQEMFPEAVRVFPSARESAFAIVIEF